MHTRFRKALLITCCCLLTVAAFTQTTTDSIFAGFGQFRLGDPQAKFGNTLRWIPGGDTTNPKYAPYPYGYSGTKPAATYPGIVDFKNFIVYFDLMKTLARIDFMDLYGQKNFPSLRRGKKNYELLLAYYTEKLKQPGKKVVYYDKSNYLHEGYEWEQGDTKLSVDFQRSRPKKTGSVGVHLFRK